uniref:Uncharacterized protein n=1 Tax=Lygus hesperus TaxID=30085 RepID=A0A0A9YAT3_LYGHE
MIVQKIKAVFLFILNLIKKSLCCLRRRRKSSADVVPLTDVGIGPNFQGLHGNPQGDEMVNWNNWEDPSKPKAPQTIEEHIQYYRSQRMGKQGEPTTPEEPQVDFFEDMTPTIKKQTN